MKEFELKGWKARVVLIVAIIQLVVMVIEIPLVIALSFVH